jgi:hypothetical protein
MSETRLNPTSRNTLPPLFEWPRIIWRSEMWLTIIPFILGFIIFFFPQLSETTVPTQIRLIIGIPLLLAPLLIPFLFWMVRITWVITKRVDLYPQTHSVAKQALFDVEQIRRSYFELTKQFAEDKQFELIKVGYFNSKLVIAVKKRKNPKINQGDILAVVDKEDNLLMGIFEVTELRSEEIYAKGINNIDPLWLGYVIQKGEVNMTPNLAAVLLNQEK